MSRGIEQRRAVRRVTLNSAQRAHWPARVQAKYEDTHARDKSLYLSWLADSYLTAGEVEQSAKATSRALDLSAGVASVRPRQRLAPVLRCLSDHRALSEVADVLEKARG
ncbi:hypothetical protein AB0O76_36575 [Streptomyces sp. NPDC086554]|uniref:hypothetical protein n=1 Tax=Streptomyces sp. NPDC086554 TaxID=3154864 RepID=UPI00341C962B